MLVARLIHHPREIPAAVEGKVQVQLVECPGTDIRKIAPVHLRQRILADGKQILPVAARRHQVRAEHVQVDHRRDPAPRHVEVTDEIAAARHVQFLAVERYEDQILARPLAICLHGTEHPRQRQERRHARGIVVRTWIDAVAQPAQMVVVRPDDDVLVGRRGGGEEAHYVADGNRILVTRALRVGPVPWLQPDGPELRYEKMLRQFLALRARGPALSQVVRQILQCVPLPIRRDQILIRTQALRVGKRPGQKQEDRRGEQLGTTFSHFGSNELQK